MSGQAHIYFIQPDGGGPIKIGYSTLVEKRLAQLAVWSPFPLKILATAPGNRSMEVFLHQRFAPWRLHCEWFWPIPGILHLIEEVKRTGKIDAGFMDVTPPWGTGPRPFGKSRLATVLKDSGVTLSELALGVGVTPETVRTWLGYGVSDQCLGLAIRFFETRGFPITVDDLFDLKAA